MQTTDLPAPNVPPKRTLEGLTYLCDFLTYHKRQNLFRRQITDRVDRISLELSGWNTDSAGIHEYIESEATDIAREENLLIQIEDGLQVILGIKRQFGLETNAEESALAAIKNYFAQKTV